MAQISTEDWVSISAHMGKYCWCVDEGMGDEWAALWEPEGSFEGITPEPIKGRAALKHVPIHTFEQTKGNLRHLFGNLHGEYDGNDRNIVRARFYNYVSQWGDRSGNFTLGVCEAVLVRHRDSWLIRQNKVRLLSPPIAGL